MHAEFASHVVLDANVFYNSIKHHVYSTDYSDWTVTNNVFVASRKRVVPNEAIGIYDPVAHLYMITPYDPVVD